MTWWEAVLSALGVIGFWPALLLAGDQLDRLFQRRQDARLWRSMPVWSPAQELAAALLTARLPESNVEAPK